MEEKKDILELPEVIQNKVPALLDDAVKLEYQECTAAGRSIVNIRFTYFASFATFFVLLIVGYQYVWIKQDVFQWRWSVLLLVLSLFGSLITSSAKIIEKRNIFLHRIADKRAEELEKEMGIQDGVRQRLLVPQARTSVFGREVNIAHGVAIDIVYYAVDCVWSFLLVYSSFQVYRLIVLIHLIKWL